jgi:nitrate reductase beta subunit
MRSYMRDINMGREPNGSIPESVGMTEEEMYDMYRLLAIAKYDERYVIPPAHAEQAHALEELATDCAVSEYGGGQEIFGEGSGRPPGRGGELPCSGAEPDTVAGRPGGRVNLLNWDGKDAPPALPPRRGPA